jgi:ethanolaminephosphotransferase
MSALGLLGRLVNGHAYVNPAALANLKLYKYSSRDDSYTTKYLLRHYWDWAVTWFPLWMAYVVAALCRRSSIAARY